MRVDTNTTINYGSAPTFNGVTTTMHENCSMSYRLLNWKSLMERNYVMVHAVNFLYVSGAGTSYVDHWLASSIAADIQY